MGVRVHRAPLRQLQRVTTRRARVPHASAQTNGESGPLLPLTKQVFQGSQYRSLERAEQDIKAYCAGVDGEDRDACLSTLATLEAQHNAALASAQNPETSAKATADLERLDSMARELSAAGSTKLMVDAIQHLQKKQAQVANAPLHHMSQEELLQGDMLADSEVQRLKAIFDRMDSNKDGLLNIGEFRAAMDMLGDHLDGRMVAEICLSMDIHGSLTFDQFKDIVEVEAVRAQTQEAATLRATLRSKSNSHFEDWIMSLVG